METHIEFYRLKPYMAVWVNQAESIEGPEMDIAQSAPTAVERGNQLFIFGRYNSNHDALAPISIISLITGVCTEGPQISVPRKHCAVLRLDETCILWVL